MFALATSAKQDNTLHLLLNLRVNVHPISLYLCIVFSSETLACAPKEARRPVTKANSEQDKLQIDVTRVASFLDKRYNSCCFTYGSTIASDVLGVEQSTTFS